MRSSFVPPHRTKHITAGPRRWAAAIKGLARTGCTDWPALIEWRKSFYASDTGPIRLAGGAWIRQNAYAPDLVTGWRLDDLLARYGSEPVTISASPVVAIGVGAGDKAAAEVKGPGMDLSIYVFDALHEDAELVLCRGRDYVSYGSAGGAVTFSHRVAAALPLAPRSGIGTKVP